MNTILFPGSTSTLIVYTRDLADLSDRYIGDLENKIKIFQNQLEQTRSSEPGSIPPSVETIGAIGNDGRIGSTQLKEPGNRDHTHSPSFTEGGGIRLVQPTYFQAC